MIPATVPALRRQTGAAFGPTRLDDLAAIAGCHTGAETVCAGTLDAARLESAFNRSVPRLSSSVCDVASTSPQKGDVG